MGGKCRKKLELDEIIMEFGRDDDMGECNKCPYLKYNNGMMTCELISEQANSNDMKKGGNS